MMRKDGPSPDRDRSSDDDFDLYIRSHCRVYLQDISGEPVMDDDYKHHVSCPVKDVAEFKHYFKIVPRGYQAFFDKDPSRVARYRSEHVGQASCDYKMPPTTEQVLKNTPAGLFYHVNKLTLKGIGIKFRHLKAWIHESHRRKK